VVSARFVVPRLLAQHLWRLPRSWIDNRPPMLKMVIGIVAVAAVATVGDYVWYEFGVQDRMAIGILHGAALLMVAGAELGWPAGRTVAGLGIGIGAGILGALTYYALIPTTGQAAMLAAWVTVWLLLALGQGRLVQRPPRPWTTILARGVTAAMLSGLTFYVISSIVWGRAPAGGRNYAQHFACWLVAWAPGLLAIGARPRTSR
jgi:hypothetical protein